MESRRYRCRPASRKPLFETLESRRLLTGDVDLAQEEFERFDEPAAASVVVPTVRVGQRGAVGSVQVEGAQPGDLLDVWIDFNQDGSYGGARERVAASGPLSVGLFKFQFDVPADAVAGETKSWLRVRSATDNEVVWSDLDRPVEVLAPISQPIVFTDFSEERLFAMLPRNSSLQAVTDLDRDGELDFVVSYYDSVLWVRPSEQGAASQLLITGPSYHWFDQLEVIDIDGDGDLDFVTAGGRSHQPLALYLNDGAQNFSLQPIVPEYLIASDLQIGDLNGDGRLDLVAFIYDGNGTYHEAFWYEQTEAGWTPHALTGGPYLTPRDLIDWDGDGDLDIVAVVGGGETNQWSILWLENVAGVFTAQPVVNVTQYPDQVLVGDIDVDGDLDLVARFERSLRIFDNQGQAGFQSRALTGLFGHYFAPSIDWADVTGDGLPDAIVNETEVYDFSTGLRLGSTGGGIYVDVDQDGDLDTVVNDSTEGRLYWNQHVAHEVYVDQYPMEVVTSEADEQTISFFIGRSGLYGEPTAPANEPLQVEISLSGDGTLGVDYQLISFEQTSEHGGVVTIPAGANAVTLQLIVREDSEFERDELVRIDVVENGNVAVRGSLNYLAKSYLRHFTVTIEDYDPADFGDATVTYGVDRERNGARHGATGPLLGSQRDAEIDGQASADAFGDDGDDGVVIDAIHVGQRTAISVTVNGVGEAAYLDAWIDFNGDGNWGGANEQIVASRIVHNGVNHLIFEAPATAIPGATFARFRLSSIGGLSFLGPTLDGEVEDYAVTVLPAPRWSGLFQPAVEVFANDPWDAVQGLQAFDFDGDGDKDIVGAWRNQGFGWLPNDGQGGFGSRIDIDGDNEGSQYVERFFAVIDFDRDGDTDIITSGYDATLERSGVIVLENTAEGFVSRFVMETSNRPIGLVDVDLDGYVDVLFGGMWGHNLGGEGLSSTPYNINPANGRAIKNVVPADLDHDGDNDLVVFDVRSWSSGTGTSSGIVRWYENTGSMRFTMRDIITGVDSINEYAQFSVTDLDSDGASDILFQTRYGEPAWLHRDTTGELIASPLPSLARLGWWSGLNSVPAFGDLNADGRVDILATGVNAVFGWLQNTGDGAFIPRGVSQQRAGDTGILPIDIDADGDIDLLSWASGIPFTAGADGVFLHKQVSNVVSAQVSHELASEGSLDEIVFTVSRTGELDEPIEVPFTLRGEALFDQDYFPVDSLIVSPEGGVLTIPAGMAEASFRIRLFSDGLYESSERLTLNLAVGTDFILGERSSATVVIADDEWGDFGDAPSPYPTLLSADGARHTPLGPVLGVQRNIESDGTPSSDAAGAIDDDGLVGYGLRPGAADSYLVIDVSAAPAGARIDAWIDLNGDGAWDSATERVAANVEVRDGRNALVFTTPASAHAGATYARIRVSTAGGLGSTGVALDGEVEDHQVFIESPGATPGTFGAPVAAAVLQADQRLAPIDFDGDGDLDFVEYGTWSSTISILENRGQNLVRRDGVHRSSSGFAALIVGDVTGDDRPEIIYKNGTSLVVLRVTAAGFESLVAADVGSVANGNWLRLADLDADGVNEVLLNASVNGAHGLTSFSYASLGEFKTRKLTEVVSDPPVFADLTEDGRLDLIASYETSTYLGSGVLVSGLALFAARLDGEFEFSRFLAQRGSHLSATDFDNDGDIDLIYVPYGYPGDYFSRVLWLENTGGSVFESRYLLSMGYYDTYVSSVTITIGDVNGDGYQDLLIDKGLSSSAPMVRLNPMTAGANYARTLRFAIGLLSPTLADFDADGDLDLVARSVGYGKNLWSPNLGAVAGDYLLDGVVDEGDYYPWREAYGATGFNDADGNGDGLVNAADYTIWRDHLGSVGLATDSTRSTLEQRMLEVMTSGSAVADASESIARQAIWPIDISVPTTEARLATVFSPQERIVEARSNRSLLPLLAVQQVTVMQTESVIDTPPRAALRLRTELECLDMAFETIDGVNRVNPALAQLFYD